MAVQQLRHVGYGLTDALQGIPPFAIISNRAPTAADKAEIGTFWVDQPNDAVYCLTSIVANVANWATSPASGSGVFTSVTVNPGDVDVTAGDVNIAAGNLTLTSGNVAIGGNLTVTGNTILNGDFDINDTASIGLTSTNNAAGAITLTVNGGTSESIIMQSLQGTSTNSLLVHSVAGGVDIRGGLATANAINIHATDAAGGMTFSAGTSGIALNATNGAIALASGTGAINIGVDAAAHTITLGNSIGATSIVLNAGTGAVNIGTNAIAHAITIGNNTGATSVSIQAGTAGAGAINIGTSANVVPIVIGNNTGASSVSIQAGTAGAGAINIGTSANAVPVVIGNVTGATSVAINSGTGGIALASTGAGDITANSSDTLLLDAAGVLELNSSAGAISIGNDAVAQAINIGTGAAARTITIGNITTSTALVLNSGTGGISLASTGTGDLLFNSSDTVLIDAAGVVEINSSGGALAIGNDAVAQPINIGTGAAARAITVGNTNTTTGVTIQAGTGGINLNAAGDLNAQVATDTQASPTATATIDQPLGKATFTGFTTAAGASQVFIITNSVITTASAILCSVSNGGANDAQMTITRVQAKAGSFEVTCKNNGAAALNGDVIITFWSPA